MSMFPDDDDGVGEEGLGAWLQATGEAMESATRPIGLYLDGIQLPFDPDRELTGKVMVLASFTIGDLAFSDKVQHPEKYRQDEQVRELVADSDLDEIAAIKEQWKHRLGEGPA